jgi:hypothetical protein
LASDEPRTVTGVCCAFLLAAGLGPRIAIVAVWLFGDRVEDAFDSWIWPLLGLIFLPWTTLAYLLVWTRGDSLSLGEWIVVMIGFVADFITYAGRAASARYKRPAY